MQEYRTESPLTLDFWLMMVGLIAMARRRVWREFCMKLAF
jgi:hypothetical protein